MKLTTTSNLAKRPRFQLSGEHGTAKTALAGTLATPGKKDVLFLSSGDGGLETISHLDLPCGELNSTAEVEDAIRWLGTGKRVPESDGVVRYGNMELCGVVFDLWGEMVQLKLADLIARTDRVLSKGASLDKASENEYGEINLCVLRWMNELRKLPLKYIGFISGVQEITDDEGKLKAPGIIPRYVGRQIWKTVSAATYYNFMLKIPLSATDAKAKRIIRTQPSAFEYAKSRIPGVAGKLPIPDLIDYKLGHPTLLRDIFNKVEGYSRGLVKLEPTTTIPAGVEGTADDTDTVS